MCACNNCGNARSGFCCEGTSVDSIAKFEFIIPIFELYMFLSKQYSLLFASWNRLKVINAMFLVFLSFVIDKIIGLSKLIMLSYLPLW